MKNKQHYLMNAVITTTMVLLFTAAASAQCIIPITYEQGYTQDFEGVIFDCWTVESIGGANWTTLAGTESTVIAFSYTNTGDEARLISPIFDMSTIGGATLSFSYAMMGLYSNDELVISYRSSETDPWHDLGSFSFNDWQNIYEQTYDLPDISSTYQFSFLGRGLGGYYIFVDNVEVTSEMGCVRPTSLSASEITPFSALLNWSTSGNEESWTLEVDGHSTTVYTQPYLLENLSPETTYTFRVKAHCAEGEESDWAVPASFKTQCDIIVVTDDAPYFDDFEASDEFICWQDEIIAGSLGWAIDPGYVIPNNTAFFIWLGDESMLTSSPLDISAVSNPTLSFKHKQPKMEQRVDELAVYYATATNGYWTLLESYTEVCPDWETITLALPEASDMYYIAFYGKSHDGDGVYVDDVWVGNDPSVGIEEHSTLIATVSPNPTQSKVTIETNTEVGEVVVFDLFGKQLMKAAIVEGYVTIDLSSYAKGIYEARIIGENGIITVKLVKE